NRLANNRGMDRKQATDSGVRHEIQSFPSRAEFQWFVRCAAVPESKEDRQSLFAKHGTLRPESSLLHYACCLRKLPCAFPTQSRPGRRSVSSGQLPRSRDRTLCCPRD